MSLLMSLVSTLLVIAHAKASPNLASIPVVCEFFDVFPKDLPRLAPGSPPMPTPPLPPYQQPTQGAPKGMIASIGGDWTFMI